MLVIEKQAFKRYLQEELEAYPVLSFSVKNYLVDLLYSYLYSDTLFEKKEGQTKFHEYCLADLYTKSQTSRFQEKIHVLKKIGDLSLYFCGFFRPAAKKSLYISVIMNKWGKALMVSSVRITNQTQMFLKNSLQSLKLFLKFFLLYKKSQKDMIQSTC